ncbi:DUF4062 domain-containing protein [Psychrobacter sp. W2-37-MNA-CIBAN-0211]|uniref:DUF4062 domain-containing protein n=1 Tax=Psychrobacter sp. W2-37-MNA-CIBAN-0211 TaxID=3140443 RepID=UPI00331EB715
MPNRRYHIHVICADNDQLLVLDSLAVFFQARAFLTYDVSSKLPKASLYGRQCIDACDYALMVVGDSYGTVQNTGVSQMHLSYLNAKAKLKPLLILVKKHHQGADISRQLQEFINTVTQQAKHVHYYDADTDIEQLLIQAYHNMVIHYSVKDVWLKVSEESIRLIKQASPDSIISRPPMNTPLKQNSGVVDGGVADSVSKPIVLTDTFSIQYSAQAYAGGNLTDVTRSMTLSWQEVLCTLMKIPATFSSYGLQSAMNRLIASKAEHDIKQEMPNVHAVARCQISQKDLNHLQRQLVAANWIQLTTYGTRVSQELWKLTFYAQNLLKNKQPAIRTQ